MLHLLLLFAGFSTYEPATVTPPIVVPRAKHCTVTLLRDRAFAGDAPRFAAYTPPAACPQPWSKVVLRLRTRIRGTQYDRMGALWLDRAELMRFTTAEPTPHGIDYSVEKDVTAYAPLMRKPGFLTAELANYVNKTDNGVYRLTATLTFYEASKGVAAAANLPSEIIPVENEMDAQPWSTTGVLRETLPALARNIVRARLDLYASNHGCDEFWYTNVPDPYAAKHKSDGLCGGGTYREIDVFIDGKPASVVYPFPYIWTGGINPLLWRPLSAIDTLDVPAYRVDLDPWAGVLSNGKPHRITLRVVSDRGLWPMDGDLLLWRDPRSSRTGGALTLDTIAPPVIRTVSSLGDNGGHVRQSAARSWSVSGYVQTSRGRVTYTVRSSMRFSNRQFIDLATGEQDARQRTTFTTTRITRDSHGTHSSTVTRRYPLVANSIYPPVKRGPYALVIDASVRQSRERNGNNQRCLERVRADAVLKRLRNGRNAVQSGTTSEVYICSGPRGERIEKKSVNGVLVSR